MAGFQHSVVCELMVIGLGFTDRYLTSEEIRSTVMEGICSLDFTGRRVLVIIPDSTRSMPMPMMFTLLKACLDKKVKALDYLVALGTHSPMNNDQLSELVGRKVHHYRTGDTRVINHEWQDPLTFTQIGTIPAEEIRKITGGLMSQDVPVSLNKLIFDYDHLLICGPVFPHEVVGFSGGNKYFFPGIAGPEIINFTHWLGAVMTSSKIIGSGYTPVRAVIDRAAGFIDRPKSCLSLVVDHSGVSGIFFGSPEEAWQAASELSAKTHVLYIEKPYQRVLSIMPLMYDDLWTAAKGMYKLEPVVADGGEVVIHAPHITEVSYSHGKSLDEIGYHCRDYFLKQWDKFSKYPGGVLAHSTHLKGLGSYNGATGVETSRIKVTLSTGIPEERCKRINLGYLDPATVNPMDWKGREAEGILCVPRAGEMLYRVKTRP
jgi:nickel-dependent lactate racemase